MDGQAGGLYDVRARRRREDRTSASRARGRAAAPPRARARRGCGRAATAVSSARWTRIRATTRTAAAASDARPPNVGYAIVGVRQVARASRAPSATPRRPGRTITSSRAARAAAPRASGREPMTLHGEAVAPTSEESFAYTCGRGRRPPAGSVPRQRRRGARARRTARRTRGGDRPCRRAQARRSSARRAPGDGVSAVPAGTRSKT